MPRPQNSIREGMKILSPSFYRRDTVEVAKDLLGKTLYRRTTDGTVFRGVIAETEAYHGETDAACHCSKGKTARTSVMYEAGGCVYVYLIYGMYHMLNLVTMEEDFPAAVLIRALYRPQVDTGKGFFPLNIPADGPGKLTRLLQIDGTLNTKSAVPENGIWIADTGLTVPGKKIMAKPRIGVDYAGVWKDKKWNFSWDLE